MFFCCVLVSDAVRALSVGEPPAVVWSFSLELDDWDARVPQYRAPEPPADEPQHIRLLATTTQSGSHSSRRKPPTSMRRFLEALDSHIRAGRIKPSYGSTGALYLNYFDEEAAARRDEPFRAYKVPVDLPKPETSPGLFRDFVRKPSP
jgi:hypothetical protein